jgi:hypothetical protein
MSKPKIGSKWTGKTAASAIGTVGIVDNSDDTILLTNTKGAYKVKEILSKEDFNELVEEETGKKVKGKNPTNRNMARALQHQYNTQSKSQAKATPKAPARSPSPKAPARSPSPNRAAASNSSMTTTRRRRPQVAPVKVNNKTRRQRPKVARESSLERNLRLIAEAETKETENLASALNAVKLANNNTNMARKLQEEENEQFARQLENQEKQEKKRKSVRRTK